MQVFMIFLLFIAILVEGVLYNNEDARHWFDKILHYAILVVGCTLLLHLVQGAFTMNTSTKFDTYVDVTTLMIVVFSFACVRLFLLLKKHTRKVKHAIWKRQPMARDKEYSKIK